MSDKAIAVGDLVMILGYRNPSCAPYVGSVRTVRSRSKGYSDHWLLEPPTLGLSGGEIHWATFRLKRIDPDILKDETPTRETTEA